MKRYLDKFTGTITPADLLHESSHSACPRSRRCKYRLLVHGRGIYSTIAFHQKGESATTIDRRAASSEIDYKWELKDYCLRLLIAPPYQLRLSAAWRPTIMATDQNAIPELIEVIMRATKSDNEEHRDIRVELRINSITIGDDDDLEFIVQLYRAGLALDLSGFEVIPRSRHGEPAKANDVLVEHKTTQEHVRQGEVGGGAEFSLSQHPTLSAKISGSAASKVTESVTSQEIHNRLRVKARGNLTWEIAEPGGEAMPLGDTYLNDDVLCKVKAMEGANMLAMKLEAFARKRDLRISLLSKFRTFSLKNKNQEKMLNAVIAKALSYRTGNGGILTFSVSEIVVEGDVS